MYFDIMIVAERETHFSKTLFFYAYCQIIIIYNAGIRTVSIYLKLQV